ncbi:MAG TPA: carboxylesterase/lipase family protein [Candidatus Limnocylindria bacterium]|nr:carboxylesterase/lipase family protein [Candidatus Limnocylindria bacterium]
MPCDENRLLLDRRKFLSKGSTALAAIASSSLGSASGLAWGLPATAETVEVKTAYGRLRGTRKGDLITFKGIPYAGPVSGENRFKAPPPLVPWTGVRDAFTPGPPSFQPNRPSFGVDEPVPSENCLVLNIWTPAADQRRRPVMFYNHGGGFVVGSGSTWYQDGSNVARQYDVVVVASNHRLGLLGYLFLADLAGEEYATSGNQGILDIAAALKWVRENIEAFGGDPHNVMVFGESGGGAKTSCVYALPLAKDYFNKASIESGPGVRMTPRDMATETSKMVLSELGLSDKEVPKLKEVPPEKLVEVQAAVAKRAPGNLTLSGGRKGMVVSRPGGFGPVVDGTYLPNHPFDPSAPAISSNKPLMVGTNRDEMAFFFFERKANDIFSLTDDGLKARLDKELGTDAEKILSTYRKSRPDASPTDLYIAITTARAMWLGSIEIAEKKFEQKSAPAYMYMFTHESNLIVPDTNHRLGAAHATEIWYKFNNVDVEGPKDPTRPSLIGTDPDRKKAALNMSEMWATFARTGHPGAKGQPSWPAYTLQKRATMMIDAQCKVEEDPFGQERAFWDSLSS